MKPERSDDAAACIPKRAFEGHLLGVATPSPNGQPWNGDTRAKFGEREREKNIYNLEVVSDNMENMGGITAVKCDITGSPPVFRGGQLQFPVSGQEEELESCDQMGRRRPF